MALGQRLRAALEILGPLRHLPALTHAAERIATALERLADAHGVPAAAAHAAEPPADPPIAEVVFTDERDYALLEILEAQFVQTRGRAPTPDELINALEESEEYQLWHPSTAS